MDNWFGYRDDDLDDGLYMGGQIDGMDDSVLDEIERSETVEQELGTKITILNERTNKTTNVRTKTQKRRRSEGDRGRWTLALNKRTRTEIKDAGFEQTYKDDRGRRLLDEQR